METSKCQKNFIWKISKICNFENSTNFPKFFNFENYCISEILQFWKITNFQNLTTWKTQISKNFQFGKLKYPKISRILQFRKLSNFWNDSMLKNNTFQKINNLEISKFQNLQVRKFKKLSIWNIINLKNSTNFQFVNFTTNKTLKNLIFLLNSRKFRSRFSSQYSIAIRVKNENYSQKIFHRATIPPIKDKGMTDDVFLSTFVFYYFCLFVANEKLIIGNSNSVIVN